MAYDFDLFVIGGGSAGVRLARIAAGHGARVGIAEARFWGGTCVNVGCVPKKFMVMAAEYGLAADDAVGFGWDAGRGAHDWARFIAAKDQEIARLNRAYTGLLERAGVAMFECHAKFIDAHHLDLGDRQISAERIAIATGGLPVRLDFPGAEHAIVSDQAFHLAARPERVVMVGGGYIAVEFAGIFAGLGSQVAQIFRQDLPLRGFDPDLRAGIAEALAANQVALHPGVTPMALEKQGGALEKQGGALKLILSNGRSIEADCVFLATGRAPNIAGLNLAAAGVTTSATGAISINDQLQTNIDHIYALGDVTDRLNLTPVATAEGHALADSLFGGKPRTVSLERVPYAVFAIPPLASVGLREDQAPVGTRVFVANFTPMRHTLSKRVRRSLMKLLVDPVSDQVLGAHMLGEDAPEIIQGLAVAMMAGARKADFDRTIGIHPTVAEEFVTMRSETRLVGG